MWGYSIVMKLAVVGLLVLDPSKRGLQHVAVFGTIDSTADQSDG